MTPDPSSRPAVKEVLAEIQTRWKHKNRAELARAYGVDRSGLDKMADADRWSPKFMDFLRLVARTHAMAPDPLAERGAFIDMDKWKPEPTATDKLDALLSEQKRMAELLDRLVYHLGERASPDQPRDVLRPAPGAAKPRGRKTG